MANDKFNIWSFGVPILFVFFIGFCIGNLLTYKKAYSDGYQQRMDYEHGK